MWGLSLYRGAASYNRLPVLRTVCRFQLLSSCGCGGKLLRHPLHKFFLFFLGISYIKCRKSSFNISLQQVARQQVVDIRPPNFLAASCNVFDVSSRARIIIMCFYRGTICLGNTYRRDKLPKQLAQALRTAYISIILSVKP